MAIETERDILSSTTIDPAPANRLAAGPVRPIAVPLWLGAERPGVELGAAALDEGLRGRWQRRGYDDLLGRLRSTLTLPVTELEDAHERLHQRSLTFLPEIADVCERLVQAVTTAVTGGDLALVLGGDHALSVGSIAGAAAACDRLGVLWLDTHPDLNTHDTSPSGHIHGLPLAAALGFGPPALTGVGGPEPAIRPDDICILGARDIDRGEREMIATQGIWTLSMDDWSDGGIMDGLEAALAYLAAQGVDAVHVSFDLDVLDSTAIPGTGTPYPGGLTVREASQIMRRLHDWDGPIHSVDWVELNPALDPGPESTRVATLLMGRLLGERLL